MIRESTMLRFGVTFAAIGLLASVELGRPAAQPKSGSPVVFRYTLNADPSVWDPGLTTTAVSIIVMQNLYDTLVEFDEKNTLVPVLADGMPQVSADGLRYTFKLKPGAKYHSGRPIKAADFKYAWERALSPALKSTVADSYLDDVVGAKDILSGKSKELVGVRVLSDSAFEVTLAAPAPYFLAKLTYLTGAPLPREDVEANNNVVDPSVLPKVGSGVMKFKEYVPGAKVVLVKNDQYYGPKTKIDVWEAPIIRDSQAELAAYLAGQLDRATVPLGDVRRVRADPVLSKEYESSPMLSVTYLGLNQNIVPQFANVKVRRAIAQAINRKQLADVVKQGSVIPAHGILPPGMPGYNPNAAAWPYGPERARALLAESGENINGIKLQFQTPGELVKDAEFIQNQLKVNLGVDWVLDAKERAQNLADIRNTKKTQAYILAWDADYIDPQNFLHILLNSKTNIAKRHGWHGDRFNALVEKANAMPSGPERWKLYHDAEQYALEEAGGIVPLYHRSQHALTKPYVKGVQMNMMVGVSPFRKVEMVPR